MSWGAIFGGTVSALGIWALLYALGLALGLSTVDVDSPHSLRSSGIFTGVWGVIAPLVALFIGGAVASRGAGVVTRAGGALHGLVMWGLTLVAGAWLVSNALMSAIDLSEIDHHASTMGRAALEEVMGAGPEGESALANEVEEAGETAENTALEAAAPTSKVFWGIFGALFLGLISAIVGGLVGVSRRQRMWADEPPPVDMTTTSTTGPVVTTTDDPLLR